MRAVILAIGLAFVALGAQAADLPQYRPVPAWVKTVPIPDKPASDEGVLLQVSQAHFGDAGDQIYDERAIRIQDTGDLARYGNVVMSWSPETETLVIHKLELIRGGQVIDQLDQGRKVQVLHRETNLERAMFDGALTATVQLEGLQVGDVVHLAMTHEVHDPVLKGHSQLWSGLSRPGKIGRAYLSADWPASKPLRWRATEGLPQPRTTTSKDGGGLVVDLTDAEAPLAPRGAPARFGALANVQMSDFASWSEVSALMAPLFDKASTLEANSPLKAEIARIKAQSKDPQAQAFAALKLVQDQIRYLFVGLNNGNLVPAAADETWRRRFGDCKAKTALLLALLHGLGLQAQPALVDTQSGDALPSRLPSLAAFDHVAVKATIAGKTYWLDGTRLGDLGLDALETPNYHWMLPVQASGAQLEALKATPFTEAHFSARLELDASAGLDAPAKAHGEHQWRGDGAQTVRLKLQSMSATERERTLRGYWQQAESWITASTVSMKDDGRTLTLVMDGSANMSWGADNRGRTFVVRESSIGGDLNFQRQPGPNADAPFAVDFPAFTEGSVRVTLPNKGLGFQLINAAPIDQVVAGAQYKRTAKIEDGVAVVDIQTRSIESEFAFAEGPAAANTLRNWGLHAIMIVSNPALADAQGRAKICGGGSPDEALKACQALLPQIASLGGDAAAVHAQMGHLYGLKRDWADAIDSFSKALAIKPDFAQALGERGAVEVDKGDLTAGMADLDRALALEPKNASLWGMRAFGFMRRKDYPHAVADFDQALALTPGNIVYVLARGDAHAGAGDNARAAEDGDRAVALDPKRPEGHALRGKAFAGQKDWAKAEQAFGEAITLAPKTSTYWMDRGLVRAELKRYADAVGDYDEALKIDPSSAAVHRYRGQAYTALGQTAKAAADLAAAGGPPPPLPIPPVEKPIPRAAQADTPEQQVRSLVASGRAHDDHGEFDLALKDLNQALALTPHSPEALIARGAVFYHQKLWDKALADFDDYISLRPTEPVGLRNRALVFAQRKDWPRALADFDAEIKVNPTFAEAHNDRGYVYYQQKDLDRALADYNEALRLKPDMVRALKNRADLYMARKEFTAALDDFTALVDKDGTNAAYRFGRGAAYVNLRNGPKALDDLDVAVRLAPNNARFLVMRAAAHSMAGEYEQAIADSDSALKVAPGLADAYAQKSTAERRLGKIAEADADAAKAKSLAQTPAVQAASAGAP